MRSASLRVFGRGFAPRADVSLLDSVFEFAHECDQACIQKPAYVAQLDGINATHATLDVTDKGLAPAQLVRERLLGDTRFGASLADQISQQFVLGTMDRL